MKQFIGEFHVLMHCPKENFYFFSLLAPHSGRFMPWRAPLNPTVVFSCAWPIGPESLRDFLSIDMEIITMINIAPEA